MIPFRVALWILRGCAIAFLVMAVVLLIADVALPLAIAQCVAAFICGIYGSESMWEEESE